MKKRMVTTLLCITALLSVSMTGCGTKEESSSVEESMTASSTVSGSLTETVEEENTDNLYVLKGDMPLEVTKLQEKNYKKGTYNYQYQTEGAITTVYQVCFENTLGGAEADKDYAEIAAESIVEKECYNISVEENETYTESMSYPVYIVSYQTGSNEDTRVWEAYTMVTDAYTYIYAFSTAADYADEYEETYQEIFTSLRMTEKE